MRTKMERKHISLLAIAIVCATCWIVGCASVLPGENPAVVSAEQSARAAKLALEGVTTFDYDNHDLMVAKLPAVHEQIQKLRREYPPAWAALRDATKAYKASGSQVDATTMDQKLLIVEGMARDARLAYSKAKASTQPAAP